MGIISSFFIQMPTANALGLLELASQAVVFAVVAVSWVFRVVFPTTDIPWTLFPITTWYQLVGWAAVDNAVFAIVQSILLCLTKRRQGSQAGYMNPEEEPLLAH